MSNHVLSFRPFRRVNRKLVVTNYMGWRKIYTSNYQGSIVKLLPFPEIKNDEIIYAIHNPNGKYKYWHPKKFEPLFWPINDENDSDVGQMLDCDGCPCFSHKTTMYVFETHPDKMNLFAPLTAEIVYNYFEKMRDSLPKIKWV